jgi:hypothetical protein
MDALAQRIAAFEIAREAARERLDGGDLRGEPDVLDLRDKRRAARHELARAAGELCDCAAQGRGRGRRGQHVDGGAMRRKRVERQIDAVQAPVILCAILEVVDDLQRGAERVRSRPDRRALPVHVEHESADRRGRKRAIIHQLRPVGVTAFFDVEPKGLEKIERMLGRETVLAELEPQRLSLRIGRAAAAERCVKTVEKGKLALRRKGGMIGDVIGRSHEPIERQDRAATLGADEPRRDGKVLVAVGLAGAGLAGIGHAGPASRIGAWIRPFQYPPRPRQYCSAESNVKAT